MWHAPSMIVTVFAISAFCLTRLKPHLGLKSRESCLQGHRHRFSDSEISEWYRGQTYWLLVLNTEVYHAGKINALVWGRLNKVVSRWFMATEMQATVLCILALQRNDPSSGTRDGTCVLYEDDGAMMWKMQAYTFLYEYITYQWIGMVIQLNKLNCILL